MSLTKMSENQTDNVADEGRRCTTQIDAGAVTHNSLTDEENNLGLTECDSVEIYKNNDLNNSVWANVEKDSCYENVSDAFFGNFLKQYYRNKDVGMGNLQSGEGKKASKDAGKSPVKEKKKGFLGKKSPGKEQKTKGPAPLPPKQNVEQSVQVVSPEGVVGSPVPSVTTSTNGGSVQFEPTTNQQEMILLDSWKQANNYDSDISLDFNSFLTARSRESSCESVFTDPLTPRTLQQMEIKTINNEEKSDELSTTSTTQKVDNDVDEDTSTLDDVTLIEEQVTDNEFDETAASFVQQSPVSASLETLEENVVSTCSSVSARPTSFNVHKHKKVELGPLSSSSAVLHTITSQDPLRRHSSVSDVPGDSNVLRKVASLTLDKNTIEQKVHKPKFVPEKLDFQIYEKFEGQQLINWFVSSFPDDHYLRMLLTSQDLKILGAQFCTHMLAAGVLQQIPDKDAPLEILFRPDLMYYWSHSELPASTPITPGRLPSAAWPHVTTPGSDTGVYTYNRPGARYTEAEFQQTVMGLKREHKENLGRLTRGQEVKLFTLRGEHAHHLHEYEERIMQLEEKVRQLTIELEQKTISDIQSLTKRALQDFDSPTKASPVSTDSADVYTTPEEVAVCNGTSERKTKPTNSSPSDTGQPPPTSTELKKSPSIDNKQKGSSRLPRPIAKSPPASPQKQSPTTPVKVSDTRQQSSPTKQSTPSTTPVKVADTRQQSPTKPDSKVSPPTTPVKVPDTRQLSPGEAKSHPSSPTVPDTSPDPAPGSPATPVPIPAPPPLLDICVPPPPPLPGMIGPPPPPMPGMGPPPPPMPGMMGPPPPPMPGMMGPPPPPLMPGMGPPPPPMMPGMGPPPPPLMPGMGPPPPPSSPMPFPAPPVGGWNAQRAALRKLPVNPQVPMKPLYWSRIVVPVAVEPTLCDMSPTSNTPAGALWEKLEEAKIEDYSEFNELFSRQIITRKPTKKKTEVEKNKQQAAKLLDSKRSQNVGILSSSLHVEFHEIENAIYNFDTTVVNVEALQQIYEVRATEEELQKIKSHLETTPDVPLDKPEQFLVDLSEIPNFADRIACFMFQTEYEDNINSIDSKLNNIKTTCEMLLNSDSVKEVMSIILALGNYMNGGNIQRGQADGFGIEILPKLRDVKSKDNSLTLLHFIVRTYMKSCEDPLNLDLALPVPEPGDINRASLVDFDDVRNELDKLDKELKICERKTEKVIKASSEDNLQPFKDKMETFLSSANKQLTNQFEVLEECGLKFKATIRFYQFKPKTEEVVKEFFTVWAPFSKDFKDIWKKEQQRLIKEKMQELKRKQTDRQKQEIKPVKVGGLKDKMKQRLAQHKP